MLSGSRDKTLKMWDVSIGMCLFTLVSVLLFDITQNVDPKGVLLSVKNMPHIFLGKKYMELTVSLLLPWSINRKIILGTFKAPNICSECVKYGFVSIMGFFSCRA